MRIFGPSLSASAVAETACRLMQASRGEYLLRPLDGEGNRVPSPPTPWHQDLNYWPVEGKQICSVWIAFDHVDHANGAMEFVAGSHLTGNRYQPFDFRATDAVETDEFEPLPDVDAHRENLSIATWDLEPGDAVVFSALTLHAAAGNATVSRRRRALSIRYAGDDGALCPAQEDDTTAARPWTEGGRPTGLRPVPGRLATPSDVVLHIPHRAHGVAAQRSIRPRIVVHAAKLHRVREAPSELLVREPARERDRRTGRARERGRAAHDGDTPRQHQLAAAGTMRPSPRIAGRRTRQAGFTCPPAPAAGAPPGPLMNEVAKFVRRNRIGSAPEVMAPSMPWPTTRCRSPARVAVNHCRKTGCWRFPCPVPSP